MYKTILDTNIFLSAFVFSGLLPQKIIDLVVEKKIQLCSSSALEEEIFRKLDKLKAEEETLVKVRLLLKTALSYSPEIKITASRDPKDNYLLELAEASKADYIITRDKDLLDLPNKRWKATKIVRPEDFLRHLNGLRRAFGTGFRLQERKRSRGL